MIVDAQGAWLAGDGASYFNRHGVFLRVLCDGDDGKVFGAPLTYWGGKNDQQDAGIAASGINTARHPELRAFSLPVDTGHVPNTIGSPLTSLRHPDGSMAWGAKEVNGKIVLLHNGIWIAAYNRKNGVRVIGPWIDIGPAKPPHAHAWLDATGAAYDDLGSPDEVDYRVIDMFAFIGAEKQAAIRAAQAELAKGA